MEWAAVNALKQGLLVWARERSAAPCDFFEGVVASLLYAILVSYEPYGYGFILAIDLVMVHFIMMSPSVGQFVTVCRQGASRLRTEVKNILWRHAFKSLQTFISNLLQAIAPPPVPGCRTQAPTGTFMAGFIAGRFVHVIIQLTFYLVQTEFFLFVFDCVQSALNVLLFKLYLIHVVYIVCVALLSPIALVVFVPAYDFLRNNYAHLLRFIPYPLAPLFTRRHNHSNEQSINEPIDEATIVSENHELTD